MNDGIFRDMAEQMKPGDDVLADLDSKLAGSRPPVVAKARSGRRRRTGWFAAAACLVALGSGVLLPGAIGHGRSVDLADPPQEPQAAPPLPADTDQRIAAVPAPAGTPAPGYEKLFAAVWKASQTAQGSSVNWAVMADQAMAGGRAPAPGPAPAMDMAAASPAYTGSVASGAYQTNAQVVGIDEGDIVKTDGRTIFQTSGKQVVVLAADGANTRELTRIDTSKGEAASTAAAAKEAYVVQGPIADMMLYGSTLVVLVTDYTPRISELPSSEVSTYLPFDATLTKALLYDVSNPAQPAYLTSLGQSGAFVTSRLLDGVLHLVTEYQLVDPDGIEPEDPETFVPLTIDGGTPKVIPAPDCFPLPYAQGPRYAVASTIDLTSHKRIDTEAVLGGSDTVYMSADNLFLAANDYDAKLSATQRKIAGVDDLRVAGTGVTHLARIELDSGKLTLGAEATVPGQVVNQFALDEYDGHLRIATTVTGEAKGGDWVTRPALYILDSKLKVTGSLPALAKNEAVQSVRFDGKVGYIVSFERRDPLFAIDLSNPKKPKVMSALKIPGFSTYLDTWSDSRLLGLGMDTDDDGNTRGMKLSMFDTSDLFDVKEQKTTKVAFDDSEALYNHKAVLVDRERGLVGFPAVSWNDKGSATARYLVYAYDQRKGFSLKQKLPLKTDDQYGYATEVRGLRIDDFLYVASRQGLDVYSASSFDKVAGVGLK